MSFVGRKSDHFILMYHHVAALKLLGGHGPFVVSPAAFQQQLDAIEARGLEVITMGDLLRAPSHSLRTQVVITFDDCPRALFDFAVPELERRGWKATFFAVAGKVGGYNDWDTLAGAARVPLMDWSQLRQLASLGHEIGAHGVSHVSFRRSAPARVRGEMFSARDTLQCRIGVSVTALAYPFGETPDGYSSLCGDAGYEGACCIFSMSDSVLGDRFAIRRILVSERDIGWRMRVKLSRAYLRARALIVDRRALTASKSVPSPELPPRGQGLSEEETPPLFGQ